MAKIQDIRDGLAAAIRGIAGLNAYSYAEDAVELPAASVFGPEVDYDKTFGNGSDDYKFWVILLVNRTEPVTAQKQLDLYLDPYSSTSIKRAIEENEDLKSVVDFAVVRNNREYGEMRTIGGVQVLATELLVEVTCSP